MKRFQKIGVFLFHPQHFAGALAAAGRIAQLAGSQMIYCVHPQTPEEVDGGPGAVEAFRESVRQQLPPDVHSMLEFDIHPGGGIQDILTAARHLELDLVAVGRRMPSDEPTVAMPFARLVRKSPCDVLVVPEGGRTHLSRIVVGVDFSPHSQLALEEAAALSRAAADKTGRPGQLLLVSNSQIGYGYAKLGMTLEQAIEDRKRVIGEQLRNFMEDVDLSGLSIETLVTTGPHNERALLDAAMSRKMDLIMAGSRGTGSLVLIGSTVERLVHAAGLPVLVVKKKGETLSILDGLFGTR